jgi:chromosome segregation protein
LRLQALELQGFKSFPEKTKLQFDRGMTVVVGPNGSGKSNISDAIRWVLGEISSKSMRGTKMEDVIFGGTDTRSPMGFAEVSLTIDNREEANRLPTDYDEITITRRYYRSGDSEYMINRKPVRLKDITEMFLNTGLGKSGYSMINQGKSTEIISQKSDERRIIFEEAAGISKYRYKKNEAERKLKEVDENMVRVSDIKDELEVRVGPLEKEAERAKKYLDYHEKKKVADVSLWLYDVDSVKVQLQQAENEYLIAQHELEMADDTLASLETQSEKLFTDSQQNKAESTRLERLIREERDARYELDTSSQVQQNEMRHLQEQIAASKQEMVVLDASLKDAQAKGETLNDALQALMEAQNTQKAQRDALQAQVEETQDAVDVQGDKIDDCYAHSEELRARLQQIELSFSSMDAAQSAGESRKAAIESEMQERTDGMKVFDDRMAACRVSLDRFEAQNSELQKKLEEAKASISSDLDAQTQVQEELTRLRIDVTSRQNRVESLRRMDELFEGYSHNIRFVMNAAKEGKLKGVYAPISRLISVEAKYSLAIETALGQNMQNIVVENEQTAKDAIALLKNANAGRATFYPLTSVRGNRLAKADYASYKGFIGIGSELVSCESKFASVLDSLLGRTLIFSDLDCATAMAKATGFKVRTVTLDGQIINAGGSFTGGSAKQNTGLLTRSSELDQLQAQIKEGQKKIEEGQKKLQVLSEKMEKGNAQISDLQAKIAMLDTMKQAENTQYQILLAQTDGDRRQLDALRAELALFDKQSEEYLQKTAALKEEKVQTELALQQSIADQAEAEEEEVALRARLQELQAQVTQMFLQISLSDKDIERARDASDVNNQTVLTLQGQIDRAEATARRARQTYDDLQKQIAKNQTDADEKAKEIEEMEARHAALLEESLEFEKRSSELREKVKDRTRHRDRLFEAYTKADAARTQITERKDKLANVMWEEYSLTYTAAQELGYPAVTQENRAEIAQVQTEYKNKLRNLGSVNVNAIEEYAQVKERFDFLSTQWNDLMKSKEEFTSIIFQLESEMRTKFSRVMADINVNFQKVFRELFGGGNAELKLTDPENVLESGIEINVAPPGKIIKSLSLLSGGEQSFVAIALLFAILNVNPTPFCVLDEVEAALDEVNVERVAEYAKRYSDTTQFIFITHRRGTMEVADVLYGVTMAERGVSKVLSLNLNEAEQKTGVKL